MRRALAILAVLGGCQDPPPPAPDIPEEPPPCVPELPPPARCGDSTASSAAILALTAEAPASRLVVVSHRVDGSPIDAARTDERGCATVASEPGALVTIVYPNGCCSARVITTLAPARDQLVVHGWQIGQPPTAPSCTPITLAYQPAVPPPVAFNSIEASIGSAQRGCWAFPTPPPDAEDVRAFSSGCLGTDGALDVVVTALQLQDYGQPGTYVPVAEAAARVPAINGVVTFAASSWSDLSPRPCPVVLDPGLPALTTPPRCTFISDGARFARPSTGLVVDQTEMVAVTDGRALRKQLAGTPASIPILADDLLPVLTGTPQLADAHRLDLQWPAQLSTADAVRISVDWESQSFIGDWTVLLPADHVRVVFPSFAELGVILPEPTAPDPIAYTKVVLGYLDGDHGGDLAAALADGLYLVNPPDQPVALSWMLAPTTARIRATLAPPVCEGACQGHL